MAEQEPINWLHFVSISTDRRTLHLYFNYEQNLKSISELRSSCKDFRVVKLNATNLESFRQWLVEDLYQSGDVLPEAQVTAHLDKNEFGDAGAAAAMAALTAPPCHLSNLDLTHNNISKDGVSAIAEALQSTAACRRGLVTLDLSNNQIDTVGAMQLLRSILNSCGMVGDPSHASCVSVTFHGNPLINIDEVRQWIAGMTHAGFVIYDMPALIDEFVSFTVEAPKLRARDPVMTVMADAYCPVKAEKARLASLPPDRREVPPDRREAQSHAGAPVPQHGHNGGGRSGSRGRLSSPSASGEVTTFSLTDSSGAKVACPFIDLSEASLTLAKLTEEYHKLQLALAQQQDTLVEKEKERTALLQCMCCRAQKSALMLYPCGHP